LCCFSEHRIAVRQRWCRGEEKRGTLEKTAIFFL
jgi:hypothetical protein